jgi:hypothetical protein
VKERKNLSYKNERRSTCWTVKFSRNEYPQVWKKEGMQRQGNEEKRKTRGNIKFQGWNNGV